MSDIFSTEIPKILSLYDILRNNCLIAPSIKGNWVSFVISGIVNAPGLFIHNKTRQCGYQAQEHGPTSVCDRPWGESGSQKRFRGQRRRGMMSKHATSLILLQTKQSSTLGERSGLESYVYAQDLSQRLA